MAVLDSVRDYAILTTDPSGKIEAWNPGARKIFGYEESEILGKDISILFTPEDRVAGIPEQELRTARETGRAEDDRWQLRKDGTRFFASGIASPLEDAKRFGYVKVLRDLTAQKFDVERKEELLASERINRAAAEEGNRLKDEFLAMLSHELRNPLALMLMQAEILLRVPEAKKSERLKHAAKIIHEMVRAQAQLVEDMVDVSRARTGKLAIDRKLLPLTFVIADSIGALRREAQDKKIALDVQIDDAPLIVEADPVRVRQIAWNLLANSLKFTPSGGTIRVRLGREGPNARLDIEDTGQGIAPDVVPHVFEWFRRSPGQQGHGMGIGLALVRQLVELHDGRVEAFSEGEGKGARFTVWLPLQIADEAAERQSASPGTLRMALGGLHLLVVDDTSANADALNDLLALEGATVTVEASAADAIRRAEREPFDLIISDIALPEMDGYAMLKAIRAGKTNARTPAIAYTGFGSRGDLERARDAGFEFHLTKPVDVDRLMEVIRSATSRDEAAD